MLLLPPLDLTRPRRSAGRSIATKETRANEERHGQWIYVLLKAIINPHTTYLFTATITQKFRPFWPINYGECLNPPQFFKISLTGIQRRISLTIICNGVLYVLKILIII